MQTPSKLDLSPIRLPAWAVTLIVLVVAPLGTALLTNTDWKPVAVGAITALVPMLAVSEVSRSKVVPTVAHDAAVQELKAVGYAAAVDAKVTGREEGKAAGVQEGEESVRAELAQASAEQLVAPQPAPVAKKPAKRKPAAKKAAAPPK